MSELDTPLYYEELPKDAPSRSRKITKKKGQDMPEPTTEPTIKKGNKMKQYNKTRGEHCKDIIIAMLVTAIVAFGLGMRFQAAHDAEVTKAVASVVVPVKK